MRFASCMFSRMFAALLLCAMLNAQQPAIQSSTSVPRLVSYAGRAVDAQGKPLAGTVGATFAIYKEQNDGAPLWMETQNIKVDAKGNYSVQLGATKPEGLPLELFSAGESRWLGVRLNGGEEQARVLLLSVPYALKAADAETVGGLPASAFLLAAAANGNAAAPASAGASSNSASVPPPVSGTGATDFVPLWLNTSGALGNSVLFQSGTGATAKVGINTTTPATTLDVAGGTNVRGTLSLPATGNASPTAGKNSQPLSFTASSYNSSTGSAVNQNFRWQAEPTGNNTASASGTLNLLYSVGGNAPAETGLKVAKNGQISFAAGQTFPIATGGVTNTMLQNSSVTITPGTALTGGGKIALGGATKLNVDTTKVPLLASNNAFTGNNAFAGTVGIGTTTAGSLLTVSGLTNWGQTEIVGPAGGEASMGFRPANAGKGGVGDWLIGTNTTFSSSGGFAVSDGFSSFLDIASNGNVGIGTITPGAGLDMSGGITINGTGATQFSTQYEGTNSFALNADPNSLTGGNGWTLYDYSAGAWTAGITQQYGAVGIGQGSPSYALDVLTCPNCAGAGFFDGNVDVDGNLSKAGGSFKIDDPVDPANKYLYHSFVESPDMMNIYNGNVTTDAEGNAVVQMPDWFEALNRDFRYQLTVIGQPAQAYVSQELAGGEFAIKTDKPKVKVSWQITGVRRDAWANAHRIPVEVQKSDDERGLYLHPELFDASPDKKIVPHRHPGTMKPSAPFSHTQARTANR
jgi:hypothetical protein